MNTIFRMVFEMLGLFFGGNTAFFSLSLSLVLDFFVCVIAAFIRDGCDRLWSLLLEDIVFHSEKLPSDSRLQHSK